MQLDRDAFLVEFDATKIGPEDLLAIIKKAGYDSNIVTDDVATDDARQKLAPLQPAASKDPIFAAALARAKQENKPLVIDFHANWCAPCLKMLKTTMPDPQVAALLQKCVFLKVDTDKHPDLARSFGVVGLPDIRFLAPDGTERRRLQDFQDAKSFAAELRKLLASFEQEAIVPK